MTSFKNKLKTISVLGAPVQKGQKHKGVETAPYFFREHKFINFLKETDYFVKDLGDIFEDDHFYENLYNKCYEMSEEGTLSIILGGDHSMAFSTVPGFLRRYPNLCVLWLDAHGDLNTPKTSPSGHLHGMPVAGLLGLFSPSELQEFELSKNNRIKKSTLNTHLFKNKELKWFQGPYIAPDQIAFMGVRDLDPGEEIVFQEKTILKKTTTDILTNGMDSALDSVFNLFKNRPIHLSFDVDVVDPIYAPATGTPVSKGLRLSDVFQLGVRLGQSQQLVSIDFTEFNPLLGSPPESVSNKKTLSVHKEKTKLKSQEAKKTFHVFFTLMKGFFKGLGGLKNDFLKGNSLV